MAVAEPLPPPDLSRPGMPPAADAGKWMALAAALLGWMFDGAEMGVFSLVGGKAMEALMPGVVKGDRDMWFNIIMASFLVGAATGGVLFGWLGDRIGRVRAMTLSVLTYALFTGFCGFATAAWQVGILRFIASLGMGGEWSLGVALVMEVWPNKSRAFMAGLIGAAANVGYLLVGFVGLVLLDWLEAVRTALLRAGASPETVESLVGYQRLAADDDPGDGAGACSRSSSASSCPNRRSGKRKRGLGTPQCGPRKTCWPCWSAWRGRR